MEGQQALNLGLPRMDDLDGEATREAVEAALGDYRLAKYLDYEEREASTTAGYTERFHGPTNVTSDQTANVAVHNVDMQAKLKAYCDRIERAVKGLPFKERQLITERYMQDHVKDYQVYQLGDNPMSSTTYHKIRQRAFYLLALKLNIAVVKGSEDEGAGAT